MTILTLSRTFVLRGVERKKLVPDYSSITNPGKVTHCIPTGFIRNFAKGMKLGSLSFDSKEIYLSNKASPAGKATLTAMSSLLSFNYYQLQLLFNLTCEKGASWLASQYKFAWDHSDKIVNVPILGKLSFIYDPECKLRIIAIVDYYTQFFLKPIHNGLMSLLRRLPCDRTYTQDPLHTWTGTDDF